MRHAAATFIAVFAIIAGARAETARIMPGPDAQERLQEALILAEPGDVIQLAAGIFDLTDPLSLDADGVTLRGSGMDRTILSFAAQKAGGEGLLVTGDNAVLENFAVVDTPGDGIKAKGVDTVSFIGVRAEWTRGPHPENGAYGLYPVESINVLIDGCLAIAASDAGIYVGQSENIVVRNSRVERNVAGIEIENSYVADVHDNMATENTGGILVFDLPDLPQQGGGSIRVFDNVITNNTTPNFASEGNIVASVPRGAGLMIMASRAVHAFDNRFADNPTADVLVVSYPFEQDDPSYNPHPLAVSLYDNTYGPVVFDPDGSDVAAVMLERLSGEGAHIVWDGVVPLKQAVLGVPEAERLLIDEPEGTKFANLKMVWHTLLPWEVAPARNIEAHRGRPAPLDPVRLPQDADPGQAAARAGGR